MLLFDGEVYPPLFCFGFGSTTVAPGVLIAWIKELFSWIYTTGALHLYSLLRSFMCYKYFGAPHLFVKFDSGRAAEYLKK